MGRSEIWISWDGYSFDRVVTVWNENTAVVSAEDNTDFTEQRDGEWVKRTRAREIK